MEINEKNKLRLFCIHKTLYNFEKIKLKNAEKKRGRARAIEVRTAPPGGRDGGGFPGRKRRRGFPLVTRAPYLAAVPPTPRPEHRTVRDYPRPGREEERRGEQREGSDEDHEVASGRSAVRVPQRGAEERLS